MWRNYVICVLIGLLIATSLSSLVLLRQSQTTQADLNGLRQRAVAAEATRSSLQQLVDQGAPTSAAAGNPIVSPNATPTPVSVSAAAPAPTRQVAPVPTLAITSSDNPVLQQIEAEVVDLR